MAGNRIFDEPLRGSDPGARTPFWFQIASRLLLLLASVFLLVALGTRVYSSNLIVAAFVVVFLAQECAALLYARAWFRESRRVDETKRELSSIYRHVLDGIL